MPPASPWTIRQTLIQVRSTDNVIAADASRRVTIPARRHAVGLTAATKKRSDNKGRQLRRGEDDADARLIGAAQRPVNRAALSDRTVRAAWKTIPSWSIYGAADRNIPPPAMAFMATRAHAREVVVVPDASHLVMVSHPHEVAALIQDAASAIGICDFPRDEDLLFIQGVLK
ncbi:alpha/beta hydrolase [Mesorhizobium sp. M0618]|uniref:alpha/beta fold hydrolase n=1 Tax=Mesorhizobium sp. M0618 TaxID=2956972 RepID=UPI0033384881